MNIKTFLHSGDLGDVIFSLPTIRALGGGILYLDPTGGEKDPLVNLGYTNKTRLNLSTIHSMQYLLKSQVYIQDVEVWEGEKIDYNLNQFRKHIKLNNLADSHLTAFNLPLHHRDTAWLEFPNTDPKVKDKILLSRSLKLQSNHTFWEFYVRELLKDCLFVGTEFEHKVLEAAMGYKVEYYPTQTIYDLAIAIASCKSFIGNASLPHALAEGLKKDLIHEVYRVLPTTIFERSGAKYV